MSIMRKVEINCERGSAIHRFLSSINDKLISCKLILEYSEEVTSDSLKTEIEERFKKCLELPPPNHSVKSNTISKQPGYVIN